MTEPNAMNKFFFFSILYCRLSGPGSDLAVRSPDRRTDSGSRHSLSMRTILQLVSLLFKNDELNIQHSIVNKN